MRVIGPNGRNICMLISRDLGSIWVMGSVRDPDVKLLDFGRCTDTFKVIAKVSPKFRRTACLRIEERIFLDEPSLC